MGNSIEHFGRYLFPNYLSLETPEFHREIYQVFENESIRRIAIAAPRGHAKTTITDTVYAAWSILHSKAKFVLLISDTYSQSVMFLDSLKAEFESNDKIRSLYGNLKTNRWSEGQIILSTGVMVKALGANMKVRGLKYRQHRPDLVIIDDLENEELVENAERRAKLQRWFNGALLPSLADNARLVIIGTVLHYDSLLYKIVSTDELYPDFYRKIYQAIKDNQALWPEHLNLSQLEQIKQDYIKRGEGYTFYQEYQNDPVSDENRKFKLEKIKYYDNEQLQFKSVANFIAIDRAYSLEKTADFTGIVVVSVTSENIWYIRLAERFKGTEDELITKIFDLKNYFNPVRIGIEQKAYEYTIRPNLDKRMREANSFFEVVELKDLGKEKNKRIEGLLPRFNTGSVLFQKDHTDLIDELIRFPRAPYDDLADGLAYMGELAQPPAMNKNQVFIPKTSNYS